jgi:hypothetical protein
MMLLQTNSLADSMRMLACARAYLSPCEPTPGKGGIEDLLVWLALMSRNLTNQHTDLSPSWYFQLIRV